ncbi:hypothetical protein F5884DRAFT_811482 [Xylogone sp. PMI_703]|nr:hypothetical protein F5884DRAFT_811482 [Xylogone sp. PMI_703]
MASRPCDQYNEFLAPYHLYIDPETHQLICCYQDCGFALAISHSRATSHLWNKHRVDSEVRKHIFQWIRENVPFRVRDPSTVASLEDGSPVHSKLRLFEGFNCRKCNYRTSNGPMMDRHVRTHFPDRRVPQGQIWEVCDEVYLQTWTYYAHGSNQDFWIVEKGGSVIRPVLNRQTSDHIQAVKEREERHAQDAARTSGIYTATPTFAGTGTWMDRTGWEETYRGKRRDILQALTEIPPSRPWTDHFLGRGPGPGDPDLVSPLEDEIKIACLMVGMQRVFDRCKKTAQSTGHTLLRWLRSTKPDSCYPKPFTLVALQSTEKAYLRTFLRFVCLVFRAYRIPVDVRRRLTGIRFRKKQLLQIRAILEHRAWSETRLAEGMWPGLDNEAEHPGHGTEEEDSDDEYEAEGEEFEDEKVDSEQGDDESSSEYGCGSEDAFEEEEEKEEDTEDTEIRSADEESLRRESNVAIEELLELLFQLCITFGTEEFVDGRPSSTLLVYFSGILGFSADTQSFVSARKYTPHRFMIIRILGFPVVRVLANMNG